MAGEYDFGRMQEEAARRARDMQARARFPQPQRSRTGQQPANREAGRETPAEPGSSARREGHGQPQEPAPSIPVHMPEEEQGAPAESPPLQEAEALAEEGASNKLLESLFKDKERTIILALLILLGGDGGNHELMFALMFLLM